MAGCLVLPAVSHADTPTVKSKKVDLYTAVKANAAKHHVIYYIMPSPRTGSNIPMVYRSYNGRLDSASSAAVYGQSEIGRTGALDVGTALYQLDPSFSVRGGR